MVASGSPPLSGFRVARVCWSALHAARTCRFLLALHRVTRLSAHPHTSNNAGFAAVNSMVSPAVQRACLLWHAAATLFNAFSAHVKTAGQRPLPAAPPTYNKRVRQTTTGFPLAYVRQRIRQQRKSSRQTMWQIQDWQKQASGSKSKLVARKVLADGKSHRVNSMAKTAIAGSDNGWFAINNVRLNWFSAVLA